MYYVKAGKRYVEANPFNDLNFNIAIMGAVRYGLGRSSYAPSAIMDFCRANWQSFAKGTRHVMMRDVMEWLGERHEWKKIDGFDSAYPEDWRRFLQWCFLQDHEEAKAAAQACVWQRDRLQGVDEFFEVLDCCKKCGGEMNPGKAIAQTYTGTKDMGEVCTMSPGGKGKLIDCQKCSKCGWSTT
jgi:hypothetical protein